MVALKRLDRRHGQGDAEFHKEVRMLSCYRHENIISLLGFSSGRDEMILAYEYASRGSLDGYLKDVNLTWTQRLKICLDAAKGLSYLHDPRETYQRLIHCDIKSANILLDENFNAKVSDFGLSKIGPANQQNSILVTCALGTPGYCDPLFMETYTLTKESDVYSFGVVLFEVLSGKLCFESSNGPLKILVPMWKQSYEKKQLSGIVFQGLMEQMNPDSLEIFADIAYKCLKRFREERPAMSLVVEKLQESLALQELHDLKLLKEYRSLDELKVLLTKGFHLNEGKTMQMLPKEYVEIANAAVDPILCGSLKEFKELLSKGVLLNGGKTWLSINKKGEHTERIYIEACLDEIEARYLQDDIVNSRFPGGRCYQYKSEFKARVRDGEDETKVSIVYPSIHMREDGWFIVPLYHFKSRHKIVDLQFEFEYRSTVLLVAGIEFQPSEEKVQLQVFEEYQDIVEVASQSLFYTSLDEVKQILSQGVHVNGYKTWFSLNEKGQHSHMISMEDCLIPNEHFPSEYESHWWSRFPAGLYQTNNKGFKTHVKTHFLSSSIKYTVNLVCYSSFDHKQEYGKLKYKLRGETTASTVNFANRRKVDDWLCRVELFQFTSDGSIVELEITFDNHGFNLQVEGILFQPLKKVEDIQTLSDSGIQKFSSKIENPKMRKNFYSTLGKWFMFNK